jgi:hypothetical protein
MASYTMTISDCLDMWVGEQASSIKDKIELGRAKLFDFDYPIFDTNYKAILETHFIRKFYMREIGFETEGLFKFNLETWMIVNMPFFNKLFESESLTFDPLTNYKLDTTHNKKADRTSNNNSSTSGNSKSDNSQTATGTSKQDEFGRHLESDTPDNRLAITTADGKGVIQYASQIQENTDSNSKTSNSTTKVNSTDETSASSNSTGKLNEIEDYIESKIGKVGDQSYASMLNEYRTSLLRIENKLFQEMQELFMLVY